MDSFLVLLLLSWFQFVSTQSSLTLGSKCPDSIDEYTTGALGLAGLPKNLSSVYDSLVRCPNIKSLRLTHLGSKQPCQAEPLNFKFRAGDRFSKLREISLDGYHFGDYRLFREETQRQYGGRTATKPVQLESGGANYLPLSQSIYFPGANLDGWRDAMDWTALEKLDLTNVDNIFFWKMRGSLPALKHLSVTNNIGRNNLSEYMTDFLTALSPLSNLSTNGYTDSVNWSQVLDRHGATLERLEIQEWNAEKSEDARPTLSSAQLDDIARRTPRLSELSINLNTYDKTTNDLLDALATFKNLSRLTTRLRSSQDIQINGSFYSASEEKVLSDGFPGVQIPYISQSTVMSIFQFLRLRKQGVELHQLEVHIGNFEMHRNCRLRQLWMEECTSLPSKYECSAVNSIEVCRCFGWGCQRKQTSW